MLHETTSEQKQPIFLLHCSVNENIRCESVAKQTGVTFLSATKFLIVYHFNYIYNDFVLLKYTHQVYFVVFPVHLSETLWYSSNTNTEIVWVIVSCILVVGLFYDDTGFTEYQCDKVSLYVFAFWLDIIIMLSIDFISITCNTFLWLDVEPSVCVFHFLVDLLEGCVSGLCVVLLLLLQHPRFSAERKSQDIQSRQTRPYFTCAHSHI